MGYTPNRQERRAAKGNIKKLINNGSPREKLSLTTINLLEEMIKGYGNTGVGLFLGHLPASLMTSWSMEVCKPPPKS